MPSNMKTLTVTIAESASLSDAAALAGYTPVTIIMPATWTAAGLSFQISHDGGVTYSNLYYLSTLAVTEYALTSPAADYAIALPAATLFTGATHIKIRSGTAGTPVTQDAARTLTLICRDL